MQFADDPLVMQMIGLLAEAIGQRVVALVGVSMDCEATANQDGYIIQFTGIVPAPPGGIDPLGPHRWAAEIRGSFQMLLDASAGMTAEGIVSDSAAQIVEMWRRDNAPTQTGVPQ